MICSSQHCHLNQINSHSYSNKTIQYQNYQTIGHSHASYIHQTIWQGRGYILASLVEYHAIDLPMTHAFTTCYSITIYIQDIHSVTFIPIYIFTWPLMEKGRLLQLFSVYMLYVSLNLVVRGEVMYYKNQPILIYQTQLQDMCAGARGDV